MWGLRGWGFWIEGMGFKMLTCNLRVTTMVSGLGCKGSLKIQ